MKKVLVTCIAILMSVLCFSACEPKHTHNFVLTEVLTENVSETARSGKFECSGCNQTKIKSISYKDVNMPVISINGSFDGISKENKVSLSFTYESKDLTFSSDATFKWQGASSVRHNYPKYNYSIQLFEKDTSLQTKKKVEFVDGWGEESKYCLKANYVDYSAGRNLIAAKLYGDVVHSRNIEDEYNGLINGGAVDGFPVLVYHNGEYLGLYTLNIPKDKWLMGMDGENEKEAFVMGDGYTESTRLNTHMSEDFVSTKWDLEYCSTEDDPEVGTAWVVNSFNEMMDFVNNNSGEAFRNGISEYINVERTIDTILYTLYVVGMDNYQNNVIYTTFDGKKWSLSVYDLDGTFGLQYDGKLEFTYDDTEGYNHKSTTTTILQTNNLFNKMFIEFNSEFIARYKELRKGALSEQNVTKVINNYFAQIPDYLYKAESIKWPNVPSHDRNNKDQILKFATLRLNYLDTYFNI